MKVVCSYCDKILGEKGPPDSKLISHGMCRECADYFERQWDGLKLGEFLDQFEIPIVVLNQDVRVVAANQLMADLLGKSQREIQGLLGGEALECRYARLPERCGNTVHCKTCTIRNTIMSTMETGQPATRVPAYLNEDNQQRELLISTHKKGEHVILTIDEVVNTISSPTPETKGVNL